VEMERRQHVRTHCTRARSSQDCKLATHLEAKRPPTTAGRVGIPSPEGRRKKASDPFHARTHSLDASTNPSPQPNHPAARPRSLPMAPVDTAGTEARTVCTGRHNEQSVPPASVELTCAPFAAHPPVSRDRESAEAARTLPPSQPFPCCLARREGRTSRWEYLCWDWRRTIAEKHGMLLLELGHTSERAIRRRCSAAESLGDGGRTTIQNASVDSEGAVHDKDGGLTRSYRGEQTSVGDRSGH